MILRCGGVREVWVVESSARSIVVHRLGGSTKVLTTAERLDGGDVVPGLDLPVRDVFDV